MKKELLTVKKLAAELRMSPKSIQRASRKGEIPVQWLSGMARFNLAKVQRARQAGRVRRGGWSIWSVPFVLLVESENRSEDPERSEKPNESEQRAC